MNSNAELQLFFLFDIETVMYKIEESKYKIYVKYVNKLLTQLSIDYIFGSEDDEKTREYASNYVINRMKTLDSEFLKKYYKLVCNNGSTDLMKHHFYLVFVDKLESITIENLNKEI